MNKRVVSEPIPNKDEGKSGMIVTHKCEKCDFIGKNQAGLKIHSTTKHKPNKIYSKKVKAN